ncbi:MAG: hypothetical protein SGJ04_10800 [Bacteroidota bacterium]|nr:hypothetical protein [Bacteroidota bacterium]
MNNIFIKIAIVLGVLTAVGVFIRNKVFPRQEYPKYAPVYNHLEFQWQKTNLYTLNGDTSNSKVNVYGWGATDTLGVPILVWGGKSNNLVNNWSLSNLYFYTRANTWRRLFKTDREMTEMQVIDTLEKIFIKDSSKAIAFRIDTSRILIKSTQKRLSGYGLNFNGKVQHILGFWVREKKYNDTSHIFFLADVKNSTPHQIIRFKLLKGARVYVAEH